MKENVDLTENQMFTPLARARPQSRYGGILKKEIEKNDLSSFFRRTTTERAPSQLSKEEELEIEKALSDYYCDRCGDYIGRWSFGVRLCGFCLDEARILVNNTPFLSVDRPENPLKW